MNHKKNKHFQQTDSKIEKALLEIIEEDKNPTVAEICRRVQSIEQLFIYIIKI